MRQIPLAPPVAVFVTDDAVGDAEKPGPASWIRGHFGDASPGDGKHFGGGIFGVYGSQAADTVPIDIGVVGFEEHVESTLFWDRVVDC